MSFKKTPLYGGAIAVDLPSSFRDTSQIRQVPDHQEVYLDNNGYTGVIFEILEYVDKATDEEALQYHFADLVDGTGDATNLLHQGRAEMKNLPTHPLQALTFLQTPPSSPPPRTKTPTFTAIHLLLLRLKEHATDILITVNAPHYAGEYDDEKKKKAEELGKEDDAGEGSTELMKQADEIRERILASFEVREWGLFEG